MRCYTILLLIFIFACYSSDNKMVINGIAINAKMEATVITDNDEVYYIDGLESWNDTLYGYNVTVTGDPTMYDWGDNNEKNTEGNNIIESRMFGIQKIIKNAKWELDKIQPNKRITVSGIAENEENGAVVILSADEIYYLYNMMYWSYNKGKKVTVTGNLHEVDSLNYEILDKLRRYEYNPNAKYKILKEISWTFETEPESK